MKRSLLCILCMCFLFFANAQKISKHVAKPVFAKKFSASQRLFYPQGISAAACDTLKYDSAQKYWSFFYYPSSNLAEGDEGFVFGVSAENNGLLIEEDANYYDVTGTDYTYITGGLAGFAVANTNMIADLSKTVNFKVYSNDGEDAFGDSSGYAGTLLGTTSVSFSTIKANTDGNYFTEFTFATPIAIPQGKAFYISIDHRNLTWDDNTQDSLAILADSSGQAPQAAYQYLQFTDQDGNPDSGWIAVKDYYYADAQNDPLNLNLFIFPYVENTTGGCSILPVSLLDFKGSLVNNNAYLTWKTAAELNNKGFEIQRSKDGKTFEDLGFVQGAGTSSTVKNYSYTDETVNNINSSTGFYRLKQIDADGKFYYSNIISIGLKDAVALKLYPNPLKDNLTVELNLANTSTVNVQLISRDGKMVLNANKGTLPQGRQQMNFNIQSLPAGSYFVRINTGDKTYTQTIIKQ